MQRTLPRPNQPGCCRSLFAHRGCLGCPLCQSPSPSCHRVSPSGCRCVVTRVDPIIVITDLHALPCPGVPAFEGNFRCPRFVSRIFSASRRSCLGEGKVACAIGPPIEQQRRTDYDLRVSARVPVTDCG